MAAFKPLGLSIVRCHQVRADCIQGENQEISFGRVTFEVLPPRPSGSDEETVLLESGVEEGVLGWRC